MIESEASAKPAPLVSIIVVTYNALDYVRVCLEGILTRTHLPFELIVVDNASDQETRAYLQSLHGIHLILNDENKLWVAGCNQGMHASDPRSRYLLLLNSDIEIKRDDWLDVMISVLESDPRVGIVGPAHFMMPHAPMYGFLEGWCLLLKREVLAKVGYIDEVRYPWTCAELELCVSAFAAGWTYKVVNPEDAILIHHRSKSHTSEVSLKILSRFSAPDHRPRVQYPRVMRDHGLEPHISLVDSALFSLLWRPRLRALGYLYERNHYKYLGRSRFYYAAPVGSVTQQTKSA